MGKVGAGGSCCMLGDKECPGPLAVAKGPRRRLPVVSPAPRVRVQEAGRFTRLPLAEHTVPPCTTEHVRVVAAAAELCGRRGARRVFPVFPGCAGQVS
ncbi:unnamed protein product [Arctogadus glacialis]